MMSWIFESLAVLAARVNDAANSVAVGANRVQGRLMRLAGRGVSRRGAGDTSG